MARHRQGRWSAAAFAISIALHGLLAALLLRLPAAPGPARSKAIPVELVEAVPGAGGEAGGGKAASKPEGPARTPRPGRAAGAPLARGSPRWMEAEGLEPGRIGRRGPALLPGELRDSLQGGIGPEMRDPSLPEDPKVSGARVRRRVKAWIEGFKAVERAELLPDEYWSRVRERLASGFKPDWSVLEGGARPPGAPSAGLRGAIEGYRARAERYGATGNPFGKDPAAPGGREDRTGEIGDLLRDLPGGSGGLSPAARGLLDWRRGGDLFHSDLTTLVLLSQAEDGRVLSAEMVESSGNGAYDRLVMERARSLGEEAARELGPPPRQGRRTLWAFATAFDVVPPAPIAGCGFDAYFVPQECVWPLKKTVKPRVKLRAVYE